MQQLNEITSMSGYLGLKRESDQSYDDKNYKQKSLLGYFGYTPKKATFGEKADVRKQA